MIASAWKTSSLSSYSPEALRQFLGALQEHGFDEAGFEFPVAADQSEPLRHAAQIARRKAQPTTCVPIFVPKRIEGDGVELGKPENRRRSHTPREKNRVAPENGWR